jgi:CBS domain-containing protein
MPDSSPAADFPGIDRTQRVADAMLRKPKTLPATARVGDARRLFEKPSVVTVLLADGTTFRGAIERGDLPDTAPDTEPALDYARVPVASIRPEASVGDALDRLVAERSKRLIVLDEDGATLRGLLCLNTSGSAFCSDGRPELCTDS